MTLVYAIKRCKSYGFSQSIKIALDSYDKNELKKDVYLICDENRKNLFPKNFKHIDLNNIDEKQLTTKGIVFVELANIVNEEVKVAIKNNDILLINSHINDHPQEFEFLSKGELIECQSIIKNVYENADFLKGKSMLPKFYEFTRIIYPILKDTEFKLNLLRILTEHISVKELEQNYPIQYESENINKVKSSAVFKDIEIIIDEKTSGKSTSMYKTSEEDLKQASLGNSTQLEAFSKGMFTVIRGRKSANINNHGDQNHDVLDILARNGVVCTPESLRNSSLDKLMSMLEKFSEFEIMFIHPSLMYKNIKTEFPNEQGKPEYNMNEGELIAVVFRYLCLNFFGYKGIYDDNQREFEFLF